MVRRGGLSVPWNTANGVLSQSRCVDAAAGAHSAKAHPSGGVTAGDSPSQVTVADSPGVGAARVGLSPAPPATTRAPRMRVVLMSDDGSKVGPQPAKPS